jgi:hypothetical protein
MDLTPFVDQLRRELSVAAAAGGDAATALADRLLGPLDAATRLTLLDALGAAADEITRDIAPGSVDVRLRGREVTFVVTPAAEPAFMQPPTAPAPPAAPRPDEDDATARVNFRPPESLKQRIEDAARAEGLSVNAWLVRVCSSALDRGAEPLDLSSQRRPSGARRDRTTWTGDSLTGWLR